MVSKSLFKPKQYQKVNHNTLLLVEPRQVILPSTARFTKVELHQDLIASESGVLGCTAEGTPTPLFSWKRKDGRPLDKQRFKQKPNGDMHIDLVQPEDEGIYICAINQNKGTTRSTRKERAINVSVISE